MGLDHTPIKSNDTKTAGNNEEGAEDNDLLDTENLEENCIKYPSGKLGAVTRKRHEIEKILASHEINYNLLAECHEQYRLRIDNFVSACHDQLSRKEVLTDEMKLFEEWFDKHLDLNSIFENKVQNIIKHQTIDHEYNYLEKTNQNKLADLKLLEDWEKQSMAKNINNVDLMTNFKES